MKIIKQYVSIGVIAATLLLFSSCQLNDTTQLKEKVLPEPELSKIITYCNSWSDFYYDCEHTSKLGVKKILLHIHAQHEVNRFDGSKIDYCFKFNGQYYSATKSNQMYDFKTKLSDADYKFGCDFKNVEEYDLQIDNLDYLNLIKLYPNPKETIVNIKKYLTRISNKKGIKSKQKFFISPFSSFDVGFWILWPEQKLLIGISRPFDDWTMKKINDLQTSNYSTSNPSFDCIIKKIYKNGELIIL